MPRLFLACRFCFLTILALILSFSAAQAAPQVIYDNALAAGWVDWSWASINLGATNPVHAGTKSIAVTYTGGWQGLYLHHAGLSTLGFTRLRFFAHGGSVGGQQFLVYAERASDSGSHGPEVQVAPLAANTWTEIQIPLANLGAANTDLTGLVWQDRSGGAQPTFYVDDIALISDESPDGPVLSSGQLLRSAAPADGFTGVVARVQVSDPQGLADIASVSLNASALGRGSVSLHDDGRSNDGAAGDGLFGTVFSVAPGTPRGEVTLVVTAQDQAGHSASLPLGAFVALGSPGGSVPAGLPVRPAWATNEWSENSGQDWQVNSGVPWDYVYQYITYGWEGWGSNFVNRFVNQAWNKNYIPVISVYLMLGVPTDCGESASCYASKLQNATTVSNYLASLQRAAQQASGAKPVIFHLEPDFYGFMQQYNHSRGVAQPDSPTNYPVALNVSGYPNNLAGFGKRLVDLIHQAAPNALVAPHASMWATNLDPNNVPASQVASLAQRTAAFINAMGGTQADLFFVEWSDRDSGCTDLAQCQPPRPWWDDTNRTIPRVSRAVLWENALSATAGKRLILWQVPAGNMSLNDTCDHYRDNRPAYAFRHPRDLYDAGVIAVLFGAGATCLTKPSTDGGFIQAQGDIAYDTPAQPTGLSAGTAAGPSVPLRWNENSEPDLWGYRLTYSPVGGGTPLTVDVGPANATWLLIPRAGQWRVTVAAYDAMGQLSSASGSVIVTTSVDAPGVYLPLIRK
ncbi:MAG: fibronectin type III domain-containing protein [Anaerolineales bacterium]|nr:fibronectin type III domain-containing protein [Anaerolineales bacterium]